MDLEEKIGKLLIEKGMTISTTESCTGGLLSSKLTDVSGSSAYITLNLVTYSNEMKHKMLNVSQETLDTMGAVSEECAYEMAKGLRELTNSDICVSTTGIAGPTGGTAEKPVGLMYSTIYTKNKFKTYTIKVNSQLSRTQIKEEFTKIVIENIYKFVTELL